MENEPKHKVDLYMTILLVLVSALIFGVLGFAYGQQIAKESAALESSTASVNYPSESTVTTSATVSATTSASATASTTSTADWKTYTNSEYGFSFKYPKDWTISKDAFASGGKYLDLNGDGIEFSVKVNADGYGVEWATDYYKGQINSQGKIEISSHEKTNGLEENPESGAATIWTMKYGENSFDVIDTFKFSQRAKSVEQYELILSTFQFTSK